ncbi:MAG: hypothetical protein ABI340_10500 [Nitrososphaera sp.]|jgi:hypothetical protein
MSYEVIRLIRQLIGAGIGDTTRLSYILDRLENGKYLYLSDQKYLESIVNTNESITRKPFQDQPEFGNLEAELRNINLQLENILQNKADNENRISENIPTAQTNLISKSSSGTIDSAPQPKSEDITLVLSVILGLISLQGIGHIYIHKITKGIGFLVASLSMSSLVITYFLGIIRDAIPLFLHPYFIPLLIGGLISLYTFQILDSRKLCVVYNLYISEHGKRPPWW